MVKKSLDGKRFVKTQQLRDDFSQTEAYSELFMSLASNADMATDFINGIVPNAGIAKTAAQGGLMSAT